MTLVTPFPTLPPFDTMAMKINSNQYGLTSLLKDGYKTQQGLEEAVFRNIAAARELGDLVRTSFGPHGLCKLVINQLDKLFLTNDAGTILRELEIEHPAAKLLLQAALQQDREMGDGTNVTVMLAAEMLSQAQGLLRMGLSPSTVAEGFEGALQEAQRILQELVIGHVELKERAHVLGQPKLRQLLETVIGSKQPGYEAFLAELALQAASQAMPEDPRRFDPDHVRIVKVQGGSLAASHVVSGLVVQRQPESRLRQAKQAKVAVFSCPLNVSRTETKGTVLLTSASQMMDFSKGEEAIVESQIRSIAESGVGVVVTGEAIGDLCLHHLDRHGILALRIPSKFERRRLCRAVGATPLARLGAPTAEEAGYVDVVETIEIGGDWCTVLRQESADALGLCRLATIVLRASSPNLLDDVERAVEDAVNTVRTVALKEGAQHRHELRDGLADQLDSVNLRNDMRPLCTSQPYQEFEH